MKKMAPPHFPSSAKQIWKSIYSLVKFHCGKTFICCASILIYFLYFKSSIHKRSQLSQTCPANRASVFQSQVQLKVFVLNVWGMPEFLGSVDKSLRMNAIGKLVSEAEYDLYLFSELWLRSDHQIIQSWLPPELVMTEIGDFSLPSCDGIISPWDCSGLTIISRFPFLDTEFIPFDETGNWQSVDGEFWAQKGVGRVRIEPSKGFITDVFVTHTCAEGPTYTNEFYRQSQAEQVSTRAKESDAAFVIVGGDLNVDPTAKETTYNALEKVLVNCFQESAMTLTKWKSPTKATYGNPKNSYSNKYGPVVYDYIWHRAKDGHQIWSTLQDVPVLRTEKQEPDKVAPTEVSLSDHEAVTAHLMLWKHVQ